MKYQKIMARNLPEEVTQGTPEGDIMPGDITSFRLQSMADTQLRAYVAEGEVLTVATKSFGAIGVFAIPEMGRFYRHVLIEKNYPHHGAVALATSARRSEVFKYLGVGDIGYNQPKSLPYPLENPLSTSNCTNGRRPESGARLLLIKFTQPNTSLLSIPSARRIRSDRTGAVVEHDVLSRR